jgi:hypothetical protein
VKFHERESTQRAARFVYRISLFMGVGGELHNARIMSSKQFSLKWQNMARTCGRFARVHAPEPFLYGPSAIMTRAERDLMEAAKDMRRNSSEWLCAV